MTETAVPDAATAQMTDDPDLYLVADRVFDGHTTHANTAVLVKEGRIIRVEPAGQPEDDAVVVQLGDATILPGIIDLHVHASFQRVPFHRILSHGVTCVRDLAGTLAPYDPLPGKLRYLSAGPMLTCGGGYPVPVFGTQVAQLCDEPGAAAGVVRNLVSRGAAVIKVSLEPGIAEGAPWCRHNRPSTPWPMLPLGTVQAIVDEAHRQGVLVTTHLSESSGVELALEAGVDEWAHVPCEPISDELLGRAVRQGVRVVTTLHTLSYTRAVMDNARRFVDMGGQLLYGTDMAHLEIPHGIDAQELQFIVDAGVSREDALAAATALAGKQLGLAPLGCLTEGAPADLIVVNGNPIENFKLLEHPDVVISGGQIVTDHIGIHGPQM